MRKLLGLVAVLVFVGVLNAPASAVIPKNPHGVVCHTRQSGGSQRTICIDVNTRAPFQDPIQGLIDFAAAPANTDLVQIQVDWIRLWQCKNATNCLLRASRENTTGWYTVNDFGCDPACSYSTPWWTTCDEAPSWHGEPYHAQVRYRMRWVAEPGDPITGWFNPNSLDTFEHCS